MKKDCEEQEDVERDPTVRRQALFKMDLDECKALLRRDRELERARALGRHKEADMQMKRYMTNFGHVLTILEAQIPKQRRSHLAASIPLHTAQNYQHAVAKEMQQQQNRNSVEQYTTEACIEGIVELHLRNRAREEEACMTVPLENAVQGPGHVAQKLIQDAKNHPTQSICFNEEQLLVIALCVWPLEQAWRSRMKSLCTTGATVDTLHKLPNDLVRLTSSLNHWEEVVVAKPLSCR